VFWCCWLGCCPVKHADSKQRLTGSSVQAHSCAHLFGSAVSSWQ
jgi:hypothetical protein